MAILDWIYPKKCVGCQVGGSYICEKCRGRVEVRGEGLRYEGVVRKVIKEIKYRGTYDMVVELVDVWNKIIDIKIPEGEWVVTSVPMWEAKRRGRGFNQAELIAREIAKRWQLPYQEMLARVRETKPMYGLDREKRRKNVEGAFAINHKSQILKFSNGERVILVDDVMSSGATMEECERILRNSGVEMVRKIAIAR